jgi:hypothetical protein
LEDGTVKFSTLIEENKSADGEQKNVPAAAPPQRRAQNPVPSETANLKAERDLDKSLKICQGC